MDCLKFVILAYLSVVIIEGIPTKHVEFDDEAINMVKIARLESDENEPDMIRGRESLLDRWRIRRRSTTPSTTSIAPGSLADLNLKMDAMKNQLTAVSAQMDAEQKTIESIMVQLQSINTALSDLTNSLVVAG